MAAGAAAFLVVRSRKAEQPAPISVGPRNASEVLGGVTEPDFASAEAALRIPLLRPSGCAANDASVSELMVNAQTQEVYVRYKAVTDPQCADYLGGSVVVREWQNGGPSNPVFLQHAMARRAVAMGGGATLTTIAGVPAIVVAGDYPGDCNESPAPGQEGCAPRQENSSGVIMQIGRTMIEVMGSGRWSNTQIESVAQTIGG